MSIDVVAIVQARLGSSRLPGKVLMSLAGIPVIDRVISQLQYSSRLSGIVVATTEKPEDDRLVEHLCQRNVRFFRGSELDVLDRYYQCALCIGANSIVRVTADCPFIDPSVVDQVVDLYERSQAMYASNIEPETFPDGLDVEVFSFEALEWSWRESSAASDREHVTQFIRRHSDWFSRANLESPVKLDDLRWTLDEPADYQFLDQVARQFSAKLGPVSINEILEILQRYPELTAVNAGIQRNEGLIKSLAKEAR
jgi:spore coat polysaccharide biosynthesis protein SpsF (cytidylyltransferase family)